MSEDGLDPRSVANYILEVREHFGYTTTNLELQKLLYFCHGLFLNKYGVKLVEGFFEAWEHGPVHPLVYREFREFGAAPISKKAQSVNLVTGDSRLVAPPESSEVRSHVAEVVLQLRSLTAWQLREKSHAADGPWDVVWQSARTNLASRIIIPDSVICERYHRHILSIEVDNEQVEDLEDKPPECNRSS